MFSGRVAGLLSAVLLLSSFFTPSISANNNSADDETTVQIEQFTTSLRPAVIPEGKPTPKWTLEERMKYYGVPGVSIAVIQDGKLVWAKAYGVSDAETGAALDEETVFSVGSVSKVGAAAISLRMVAENLLELDQDVNSYLETWKVDQNQFTRVRPITLRHILSHTSGLSVHGFPDFKPGEDLPSVYDTLDGIPPAKTKPVRSLFVPGMSAKYSGGAITLEQLLIADVTGDSFENAARKYVFEPLGMTRSTYENPLPAEHGNIAHAHDGKGQVTAKPRRWHAFPEKAASGLWTTPTDVAKLLIAFMESYHGEEDTFLPQPLAIDMMTEVGPSYFGLGPQLTGKGKERRFFHSGSNESYKAWFEGHLETGDGLVIFTNAAKGSSLYYEIRSALADVLGWPFYRPIAEVKTHLSADAIASMEGIYTVAGPLPTMAHRLRVMMQVEKIEVSADKNGQVAFSLPGLVDRKIPLTQIAPLTFIAENVYLGSPSLLQFEFIRSGKGDISEIVLSRGPYSVSAMKSEKPERH